MKPQRFWAVVSWTGSIVHVATEASDKIEAYAIAARRRDYTGRDYEVVRVEVRIVERKPAKRKARAGGGS